LLVPGSIKYLVYDKDNSATRVESENIIDHFKYSSDLRLLIHCILFRSCLWGNPGRKLWQTDKLIDKIRIIRCLGAICFEGACLFFELRGDGIDRKIAEIVAQQKVLLHKNLPPMSIL
jgi:hypothetical protein